VITSRNYEHHTQGDAKRSLKNSAFRVTHRVFQCIFVLVRYYMYQTQGDLNSRFYNATQAIEV